jgi:phage shock protein C
MLHVIFIRCESNRRRSFIIAVSEFFSIGDPLLHLLYSTFKWIKMSKRLVKGRDKKIFGVCSGLGEYFDIDPTIVRVIFLFALIAFGTGLLLYLILALVMPNPDQVV